MSAPRSLKKYYRLAPLLSELIKAQQQNIDFLTASGVHYKEVEQKQKFLTAIKNYMEAASEAIIDLQSEANSLAAKDDMYITELQRQRDYYETWEQILWAHILKQRWPVLVIKQKKKAA